jgi:hypothetical protein
LAIAILDQVILGFRRQGVEVGVAGLNEARATLVDKLAIHDKSDVLEDVEDIEVARSDNPRSPHELTFLINYC